MWLWSVSPSPVDIHMTGGSLLFLGSYLHIFCFPSYRNLSLLRKNSCWRHVDKNRKGFAMCKFENEPLTISETECSKREVEWRQKYKVCWSTVRFCSRRGCGGGNDEMSWVWRSPLSMTRARGFLEGRINHTQATQGDHCGKSLVWRCQEQWKFYCIQKKEHVC